MKLRSLIPLKQKHQDKIEGNWELLYANYKSATIIYIVYENNTESCTSVWAVNFMTLSISSKLPECRVVV